MYIVYHQAAVILKFGTRGAACVKIFIGDRIKEQSKNTHQNERVYRNLAS